MSWVRPDWEILPQPSTHSVNAQFYDAVMVVVSQKLRRKCTIPADQWYVNPLCYRIAQSCFSRFFKGNISCLYIIPKMVEVHLKDLLGSITRVGYCIPVLDFLDHYNGLINQSVKAFYNNNSHTLICKKKY